MVERQYYTLIHNAIAKQMAKRSSTILIMDNKFARYLVGELLWELEQFDIEVAEIQNVHAEQIEVLSYTNCNSLRICVGLAVFDIALSWRGDVAPTIQRIAD